ncbi:MAG: hypothetical protein LBC83_06885 [Oscillospiraceae bacterium]|jgi:hypothetical protein|nr:hypothetical protein [Oscillospiraceae bacterium]
MVGELYAATMRFHESVLGAEGCLREDAPVRFIRNPLLGKPMPGCARVVDCLSVETIRE